ncbi:MAG: hypothetical protein CMP59_06890 [Flavobacteriales bacterium]|nr:hypothetical protein [Flavobacteriales bacterium]|tara:strand:+ start:1095 stop:1625 length:531 start_codon:yes stop_codon:yes gene_type:complete
MLALKLFILSLTFPFLLIAQEERKAMNSLQFELGGHGVSYTISYERFLISSEKFKLSAQSGFSYNPPIIGMIELWLPVNINQLYSIGNHYIESGFGIVPHYSSVWGIDNQIVDWEWYTFMSARVGFRFQHASRPFFLRAGFTPFFEIPIWRDNEGNIKIVRPRMYGWVGAGLGYKF